MAYRVEFSASAEAQLEALYLRLTERAPHQGAAWFNGLEEAILALDRLPSRCPFASESAGPEHPIRVLHYGRAPHVYRVLFTIDEPARRVYILHVRHGARRRADPGGVVPH
jgi:plasmid stabilization system protein ParE